MGCRAIRKYVSIHRGGGDIEAVQYFVKGWRRCRVDVGKMTNHPVTNDQKVQFLREVLDATEDKYHYYAMLEQALRIVLLQNNGEIEVDPAIAVLANNCTVGFEFGNGVIRLMTK